MEDGFSLRLFGSFEAYSNGRPLLIATKKTRWLLVLLALRAGKDVDRDWLCSLLWPDSDAKQGRYNLRRSLSDLRSELQEAGTRIVSDNYQTVRLSLDKASLDTLTFDQLASRKDIVSLERALSLYRAPLLEECSEEWIFEERDSREQRYLHALEILADLYQAKGDNREAIHCLRLFVKRSPYSEPGIRKLMLALANVNDIAEACRAYTEFCNHLWSNMRVEPAAETKTLWEQLKTRSLTPSPVTQEYFPLPVAPIPVPQATPATELGYLPRLLTPLIGREEETDAVVAALNRSALVTLIGPGGVGKTSLGLAVGKQVTSRFVGGVWFIDLASITLEDAILPTFLQSLGRRCSPECSDLTIVQEFLRPRQSLLVLDNCEHLSSAIARLTRSLLEHCPQLKVLATSRQPLEIPGEQRFHVHPLPTPPPTLFAPVSPLRFEEKNMAGLLMEYPSVRLFVERVRQVRPQIALTNENALLAAQICTQLEGLPLALELAAARASALSMSQSASRLESRFRLIMGNTSASPSRHETLRALLDWSYDLLTPAEQVLLQRLAVFSGGASLEAVEAICLSQNQSVTEILDLLTTLTNKSLVRFQEYNGGARHRLLETVREYAREKLEGRGETNEVKNSHFQYFLAFTQNSWRLPVKEGMQALETEYDNIRAALEYSLNRVGSETDALDMVSSLQRFWEVRGYLTEARKYLQQALSLPGSDSPSLSRVRALRVRANFERLSGHLDIARTLFQESISLAQPLELWSQLAQGLNGLSNVFYLMGDMEQARHYCQQSLDISDTHQDRIMAGYCLLRLADIEQETNNLGTAQAYCQRAIHLGEELGELRLRYEGHALAGHIHLLTNDKDAATASLNTALRLFEDVGNRGGIAHVKHSLGELALQNNDVPSAEQAFHEALSLNIEIGYTLGILECLCSVSVGILQASDPEKALYFLGCIEQGYRGHNGNMPARLKQQWNTIVSETQRWVRPERVERVFQEGAECKPSDAAVLYLKNLPIPE